jgi:hypothetical protein
MLKRMPLVGPSVRRVVFGDLGGYLALSAPRLPRLGRALRGKRGCHKPARQLAGASGLGWRGS